MFWLERETTQNVTTSGLSDATRRFYSKATYGLSEHLITGGKVPQADIGIWDFKKVATSPSHKPPHHPNIFFGLLRAKGTESLRRTTGSARG